MNNRWVALAIIFASFIQFTLNWFCIIPAFGAIVGEMRLSFAQVGGIVGAFIAGYGIAHIPGGSIAERYGMRTAMLLGIAVETAGAGLSAWAPTLGTLLAARFVCGVGGSIYLGSAVGLTAAWFRGRELATANGLVTGVAFTVGAAVGLFGWGSIVGALLVPHLGLLGLEMAAAAIGAAAITAFVVWVSIPGQQRDAFRVSDIPTAAGLMLTVVAVGGAVVPPLYSQIAAGWGFGAAWAVKGLACLGFAALALLAPRPGRTAAVVPAGAAGGGRAFAIRAGRQE